MTSGKPRANHSSQIGPRHEISCHNHRHCFSRDSDAHVRKTCSEIQPGGPTSGTSRNGTVSTPLQSLFPFFCSWNEIVSEETFRQANKLKTRSDQKR